MRSYCDKCNEIRQRCCDDADTLRAQVARLERELKGPPCYEPDGLCDVDNPCGQHQKRAREWYAARAKAAEALCKRYENKIRNEVGGAAYVRLTRAALAEDGGGK